MSRKLAENDKIRSFDDDRQIFGHIAVTLEFGYCFYENNSAEHDQMFENVKSAIFGTAQKRIFNCECADCLGDLGD